VIENAPVVRVAGPVKARERATLAARRRPVVRALRRRLGVRVLHPPRGEKVRPVATDARLLRRRLGVREFPPPAAALPVPPVAKAGTPQAPDLVGAVANRDGAIRRI
jgi:hypothetical protein